MTAILYAQGAQTIRCVPVDVRGVVQRVTSATYSIVDLREPEEGSRRTVVASTAAAAPSVSTTISAAAGPSTTNPKRFTVASLTGIRVGSVLLLKGTTGATDEAVTVQKIAASGLELEATRALTRAFASSSTVQGLELEGTFPSDVAGDELRLDNGGGPFQATWVYTIGGQAYVNAQELWLTRYGVAPWVRFDECERHLPGLAQSIGDAVDPAAAIRAATDDYCAHLLTTAGGWRRDPAYYRGNLSADLGIRKRAIYYMLLGSRGSPLIELADRYSTEALTHWNSLTEGKPPTHTAAVHPGTNTAQAGGETLAVGGYFSKG